MKCLQVAVADLVGGAPGHPPGPKCSQFHAVFLKIICWRTPLEGWRPLLRGILDPPLSSNVA